jgi:uncharacterized Zn finger protein
METAGGLRDVITHSWVRRYAGDRYYERGAGYFRGGRVTSLEESGDSIRCVVMGTQEYGVRLTKKARTLEHHCECPIGSEGDFCKHCVAAALAWLHQQSAPEAPAKGAGRKKAAAAQIATEDLTKALREEDKETLINWLLAEAETNEALRSRLMLAAARRMGSEVLIAQTRKTLEKAIRIRQFAPHRNMRAYAAQVEEALDGVEGLLDSGHAAAMIDPCERGLHLLAEAMSRVDDSDGYMSVLLERLEDLHLRACEAAPPDPVALGEKLFQLEWKGAYNEWDGTVEKYADLLGEQGLAAFRKKADVEWAKVPVRMGSQGEDEVPHRFRLTSIMESLAQRSGDMEQLVGVLARDLDSAHRYLRIARLYRDAGQHEEALAWAMKGLDRNFGTQEVDLRLFVAEDYQRRGCHADALRMVWVEFRRRQSLSSYQLLEKFARQAEDWDDWRAQSLAHIRRTIAEKSKDHWLRRDHSLLVEIFLYEKRPEEAWQEAQAGGCGDNLWLTLAKTREKEHPEDAAAVYFLLGDTAITGAMNSRYEAGVQLLEKAAALLHAAGRREEFAQRFAVVMEKHKAKPNLHKVVEKRRRFLFPGERQR